MSSRNAQVEHPRQYRLNLILSAAQKAALDRVVRRKQAQFPAFKITQSDVIRELIARADQDSCPQCGSPTRPDPGRAGCVLCEKCQEPILFDPTPILRPG